MTTRSISKTVRIKKFDYKVDGIDYEVKCPTGNGHLAVVGNIPKADTKFRDVGRISNVVISKPR